MKKPKNSRSRGPLPAGREFRLLFQHCPDGVLVADRNGVILAVNPALCQMSGYAESDLVGRSAIGLAPSADLDARPPRWEDLRAGETVVSERRIRRKDGSLLVIEASLKASPGGRFVAIWRDLTDRLRLEAEWGEATDRLRQQLEHVPLPTYTWKRAGDDFELVAFNRAGDVITGGRVRDVLGKRATEYYPDMPDVVIDMSRCLAEGVTLRREMRYRFRATGEIKDLVVHYVPLAPDSVVVYTEEVTKRKHVLETLRRSEERFRLLSERAQDIVFRYRLTEPRGFEYVSPAATRMVGYTPEEHYADPDLGLKIVHPDDRHVLERWVESPLFERPLVLRWRRKDGTELWIEQLNVPVYDDAGNLVALEGIARDITDRVAAEQALTDWGRQLAGTLAGLGDIVYRVAFDDHPMGGRVEFVSDSVQVVLGYRPEEFVREPGLWARLIHPEDAPDAQEGTLQMLASKRPRTRHYRLQHRVTGVYRWMEDHTVPQLDADGRVVGLLGAARDVTDRRQAEERLRLLESVVVHANDAVVITEALVDSPGPVIVYVNDAFTRMTGYTPDEAIGRSPRFLQGPRTDRDTLFRLRQALAAGEPSRAELINYRKDGSEFWVDLAVVPLYDTAGRVGRWVSIQRDIGDRKQAEEAMRESREGLRSLAARLESVREEERTHLAREVHDEFGQALTGLKLDLTWLLRKPAADEAVLRDRLRAMVAVVDTTIGQVRHLAARLRPAVLDDLGLVAAVEWQVQETSSKSGLEYSLDLPVDAVEIDPDVATAVFRILQEALTNVLRHAAARHFEVELVIEDEQLVLEVRDDGKGVSDEGLHSHESLGFIGMRERARVFGGGVDIGRAAEGGTVVRLTLPLRQSDRAP